MMLDYIEILMHEQYIGSYVIVLAYFGFAAVL